MRRPRPVPQAGAWRGEPRTLRARPARRRVRGRRVVPSPPRRYHVRPKRPHFRRYLGAPTTEKLASPQKLWQPMAQGLLVRRFFVPRLLLILALVLAAESAFASPPD